MAEGEFALIHEYGEAGLIRPSKGWATFGDHDLYSLLADAAAAQHDESTLQRYVPLAEESARRYDHRLYQAIAHRSRGVAHRLAGEYVEAESSLNQALGIFNDMNTTYQIGRTLFELGELAAAQTDIVKAREYFTRALMAFEIMGALPDVAQTRKKMAQVSDSPHIRS